MEEKAEEKKAKEKNRVQEKYKDELVEQDWKESCQYFHEEEEGGLRRKEVCRRKARHTQRENICLGRWIRWLLLLFAAGTRNVRCKRCCGRFTEGNSGVQNARRNAVQRGKRKRTPFLADGSSQMGKIERA